MPTTYTISDTASWRTVANTRLISGDTVNITSDLTFVSVPFVITLTSGVVCNGGGHTLTIGYNTPIGFFKMTGGSVNNLHIDGGAKTYFGNEGMFVNYSTGGTNQWGNFSKCSATNATMGNYSGGISCYNYGSYIANQKSYFDQCWSNITTGAYGGGICGRYNKNCDITNCYFNGTMGGVRCGGITGDSFGGNTVATNNTCNITGCWVKSTISQTLSAGIVGGSAWGCILSISQCFTLGNLTGYSTAGIIGSLDNMGTINIINCYFAGNITNSGSGFASCFSSGSSVASLTIINSYHVGTINNGASVIQTHDGNAKVLVVNCILASTTYKQTGARTPSVDTDTSTNKALIENGFIKEGWSPCIWGTGQYPILKTFQNTSYWDGTYISYTGTPKLDPPADIPSDIPADSSVDIPVDTSADTPVDIPADTSADTPVDTSADTPVDIPADTSVDPQQLDTAIQVVFKIGDRVRYIDHPGQKGTVVRFKKLRSKSVVIEWDQGEIHSGSDMTCAYFGADYNRIELDTEK